MRIWNMMLAACLLCGTSWRGAEAAPARTALIIGNAAYQDAPLTNPAHDAQDMAAALERFGFEVLVKTNVDRRAMIDAIQEFGRRMQNGGVAVFYYSGHGMQSQNVNYLLPLKMNIQSEADVEFEAVSADRVLSQMEQANDLGINIIILDACRDNPYKSYMKGASPGLAQMDSPMGSLIAYAMAPGKVAYTNNRERNSIYTKHLLAALSETPEKSITDLLIAVRNQVRKSTNQQQVPWEATALTQQFCFGGCGPSAGAAPEIAALLAACAQHLQANRLTTGRGGNALECFEQVLALDPVNRDALAGLASIEKRYIDLIQQALASRQMDKARTYLERLRAVNPESLALADLEAGLTPTSTPTAHPSVRPTTTPTPVPQQTPRLTLRSTPLTVSEDDFQKECGLDANWRPLKYVDNDFEAQGEVVIDHATGLIWQKSGSDDRLTYQQAQEYIEQLNQIRFAGYNDWRLPTIPELLSLLEPEKSSNGLYINPIFDERKLWCWSSDKRSSSSAWVVGFPYGYVGWYSMGNTYYVRVVHS